MHLHSRFQKDIEDFFSYDLRSLHLQPHFIWSHQCLLQLIVSNFKMDINPPLIVCVCVHSVLSNSCNPMDYSPPGLLCPWGFSGKSTGVGCHFFLQRIFPTQGLSHISGVSCRAGRFFTTEPAGKPSSYCILP